ncbi:hypothetical protein NB717_003030 [Xanthomonas sacchari]|nr:hypothetical protein [Xanthomonas sacchari]
MRGVQFDQIGRGAHAQTVFDTERLRRALRGGLEQQAAAGQRGVAGEHIAPAQAQALAVLEQAQFLGRIDQHVGVRPHAEAAAGAQEVLHREQAVAEVGLGDRAQPDHRATGGDALHFRGVDMGGVHQAPARIHRRVRQQPLHRALPAPGQAGVDFAGLLGDMDVHRAVAQRQQRRQFVRGDRAQAVRGQAQHRVVQSLQGAAAAVQQRGEAVDVVQQALLRRVRRGAAEIGMRIEHRQQGHADTAGLRRGSQTLRHLGAVGVGAAVGGVMHIMELADPGEAGLEHLHVGLLGDGLQIVGAQPLQEAVHQLAPAPEAVAAAPADLGEPGHAALEGVAVQIAQPGHHDVQALIAKGCGHVALHRGDAAAAHADAHVARPALRQQRVRAPEFARSRVAVSLLLRLGLHWTPSIDHNIVYTK